MVEYICDKCDKVFINKTNYNKHVNRKTSCIKDIKDIDEVASDDDTNSDEMLPNDLIETKPKNKKKHIPKILRNLVWDTYIGKIHGIGLCYVCSREIDSKDFECGHVLAESKGGETCIQNLRPVCSCCNKSMGSTHMDTFKQKYFPTPPPLPKKHKKCSIM
jgi:5-methylcytosine-specific restriction endonuclease McrA